MEKANVNSPCDGNCHIDIKTNLCVSCFRTMSEIIKWINITEKEKRIILKQIEERKKILMKKNG